MKRVRWKGASRELMVLALVLRASLRDAGYQVRFTSAVRSRAEQEALYAARHANPYPVAVPGTSRHERGLAFDAVITPWPGDQVVAWLAEDLGLTWSERDRVHFQL